jgi:N-acetylglucosaminyldiphosphoundecaprenol N-acetyl-beta-D-mannosaminyltransferase
MTKLHFTSIADRCDLSSPGCAAFQAETAPRDDSRCTPGFANVLGVNVSAVNTELAVGLTERWIDVGRPGYVCVTGVHGVMEAQNDQGFLHILNHAAINLPDGMPMTWVGRLQGFRQMDRVFGPDFMAAICRLSVERGYRNFFYGGQPGVADLLNRTLTNKFPGLQVVGTYTPPFRPLTPEEEVEVAARISQSGPHIVWVGLSTPKQERFMAQFAGRLNVPLMVGVGAAFDYHTGQIRDCSSWIKRAGLQWLHRLIQDPKRLWKRYLINNPAFIWRIVLQFAGMRANSTPNEN